MLNEIFKIALEKDASDIHLVHDTCPYIRAKRELIKLDSLGIISKEQMNEIFKIIINNDEYKEKIFYTTRKLDISYDHNGTKCRVNISFATGSYVITMRIIKKSLPTLEQLGLPGIFDTLIRQSQGLLLVTGKTNSGKSTTLNVIIDRLNNTEEKKIITLEHPIEYVHKSNKCLIVQKEVGESEDTRSFSEGVKNSLREDGDVLVIGEIRDRETMDTAIEMAESGHFVIGTIHTKSCAETIDRIINLYDIKDQQNIKYLMSTLLKAVISQRLVKGTNQELIMIPEVMIVDSAIAGSIRKEKFSVSEIEDLILSGPDKGNISLIHSLAKVFVEEKLSLEKIKEFINESEYDTLNRIIMQTKIKK